jgi:transcriptional regulator with XRE-family HTH domain
MSGRKPFKLLTANLSSERRARIEQAKERLRGEMTLAELRQARQLTQEAIGDTLRVGQPSVAKIEKRTDMYVGNLRRFVRAMGGELDIIARFPEGEVKISNFSDIETSAPDTAGEGHPERASAS